MSTKLGGTPVSKKKTNRKKKFVPHAVQLKTDKKSESQSRIEEQLKESNEQLQANQAFKQLITDSACTPEPSYKRNRKQYDLCMNELNNIKGEAGIGLKQEQEKFDDMDVDDQKCSNQDVDVEDKRRKQSLLDYLQQYPTMLPLRQPQQEAAAVGLEDLGKSKFLPNNILLQPEAEKPKQHKLREEELQIWQFPKFLPLTQDNLNVEINNINAPMKIGKLVSYESGKQKMVINNVEFDFDCGTDLGTHVNVAVLDLQNKRMCHLGEVEHRAVCSPNIQALLQQNN